MRIPEHDLEPLSAIFAALCISGAAPSDLTAQRAVLILSEADEAIGFASSRPRDVHEIIAGIEGWDGAEGEEDEDDDEDDEEDDDDDEDDEGEGDALEARLNFIDLVADLIKHGGDTTKVVAQAAAIGNGFSAIFVGDPE